MKTRQILTSCRGLAEERGQKCEREKLSDDRRMKFNSFRVIETFHEYQNVFRRTRIYFKAVAPFTTFASSSGHYQKLNHGMALGEFMGSFQQPSD